ncbi:MAG: ComEC/Rec2 family competence protein [Chloroflexota bacterium]|nr:ComEC/Rec2 family competence protein [Chloroflexota bacterium]
MSLIYLSGAWVLGIWLGSRFGLPLALMAVGLIPLPFLFFFRNRRKTIILSSLCLVALFGGAAYFPSNQAIIDESRLQSYNDRGTVEIRGTVNADPEIGDKTTHLRFAAAEIRAGGEWQPVSGTALLFVPVYAGYSYGDVLNATGKLQTPPQLSDFDYPGYLAHQGIYSTMLYPKIEVVAKGQGSRLLGWVYALRSRLSQTLAAILPEPQAALAQGILLGIRGNIPPAVSDAFSRTGTAHILAISGVNLTIVAAGLLAFGIWLFGRRRHLYVWLAFGLIWLYALLTGMQPPVVRGAIMASLFFAAEALGRQRSAFTALSFAAAVMVGINPELLWDASFQLSFLAMAGLIFVSPAFITLGRRAVNAAMGEDGAAPRLARVVTDSFGVTLGAIIAVWPVVAHYFGIFSLVGLPATLLAMPALPAIIVTGALAGGVGLIFLPAAQVIAWATWLFLSYMLLVVQAFTAIPNTYIEVSAIGPDLIVVYYLGLALAIWGGRHRTRVSATVTSAVSKASGFMSGIPRKYVIPPLLIMAVLVWVAAATMPDDNTHISFLDVGQGDAALIQTAGQDILIDGGPGSQGVSLGLGRKMPFWDRTIELFA